MLREKILTAVGKAGQKMITEECSNGNGPGLWGFIKSGMDFEIGDYDFQETMAQKIRENTNGGCISALLNNK